MGIKGLKKLIKDICPEVFKSINISNFAHEKVGIDASLYMYKYKAVAGDRWLSSIFALLMSLKRNKVHPIVVLDGKAPPEKDEERKRRRSQTDKLEEKSQNLFEAIEEYKRDGTIQEILIECMKIINNKKGASLLRPSSVNKDIDINALSLLQEQYENQIVRLTKEDVDLVKTLCDLLHIQWVQAPGEAEAFCCYKCVKGEFAAVLSEDSDIITYKCPVFLLNYNITSGDCLELHYEDVLEGLNLDEDEFLDLCIMCGTDYNSNIPSIGGKTSYKLIQVYGVIENIEDIEDKTDILKYKRGREIFNTYDNKTGIIDRMDLKWNGLKCEMDFSALSLFLTINNCQNLIVSYTDAYNKSSIEIEIIT